VDETYDKEEVRGVTIRYWDDVKEGDMITPVAKGPLNLGDIQGYASASIQPLAYGELIRYLRKHPTYGFHHPCSPLEQALILFGGRMMEAVGGVLAQITD